MVFGIIGIMLLAGATLGKIGWGWGVLGAIFLYFPATRFWTKYKAASNAILAHHTFNLLSESDRKKVLVAASAIMSNAKYPIQDPEQELNSMAPEQRYGFLALGMARIGIAPKIGGGWYDVHNPYAEILGANREITFVRHQIRLRYGVDVNFSDVVVTTVQLTADQGIANAQIDLGTVYDNETVSQNDEEAVGLNRLAANQGDADAQFKLGTMYANGTGVPQDDEEAVKWYRLAADQGHDYAQFNLGGMYYKGKGVPQDYEEAAKWYRLAADQGNDLAQLDLAGMCSEGQCAPQVYKKIEVGTAAAIRPALQWPWQKEKPAPQYEKEAVDSLCKSAEQGDAEEQLRLGDMYSGYDGFEKNDEQAAYWYRKAAEQGGTTGQWKLGDMYREGHGVEQDDEQAAYWFRKAAEQQDCEGQARLGDMYKEGRGVEKNYEQAMYWYLKAAEQGPNGAAKQIGDMYKEGLGVEKNIREANYWYSLDRSYNAR